MKNIPYALIPLVVVVVAALAMLYLSPRWYADERIEWVNCWFGNRALDVTVRCARFYPGETMGGREVSLPVVILGGNPFLRDPQPLVFLQGGPGFPTGLDGPAIQFWIEDYRHLSWKGDLILHDQRGVGLARPAVQCTSPLDRLQEAFNRPLDVREDARWWQESIKACVQEVMKQGFEPADLSVLSTRTNVADLKGLIDALGYEQVALQGVSYGTRVAMQAAREMPDRIAAMVLDSAYPPHFDPIDSHGWRTASAFKRFARACRKDGTCRVSPGDVMSNLERIYHRLEEEPEWIPASSDQVEGIRLTGFRFLEAAFVAMYQEHDLLRQSLVWPVNEPAMQFGALVDYYLDWVLDEAFSLPVFYAVDCGEVAPPEERSIQPSGVRWIDELVRKASAHEPCDVVPVELEPSEWREPVQSGIPTLFLAGDLDPVTPVDWTLDAAKYFENGYVEVFSGTGHGAMYQNHCAMALWQRFLQNPHERPVLPCLEDRDRPGFRR